MAKWDIRNLWATNIARNSRSDADSSGEGAIVRPSPPVLFLMEGNSVMDAGRLCLMGWLLLGGVSAGWAANAEVLRPRVPIDQIEAARTVTSPFPVTPDMLQQGKALFEGKAFCRACHGSDGKGLGMDLDYSTFKGPLPRNFTDKLWQQARTDGELFWILKNGSPGTDMAPFIPLVLTEEEAWQVLMYVRSFGGR